MGCEREYEAYQQAQNALDEYRKEHLGGIAGEVPISEDARLVAVDDPDITKRLEELEAAANEAKHRWQERQRTA